METFIRRTPPVVNEIMPPRIAICQCGGGILEICCVGDFVQWVIRTFVGLPAHDHCEIFVCVFGVPVHPLTLTFSSCCNYTSLPFFRAASLSLTRARRMRRATSARCCSASSVPMFVTFAARGAGQVSLSSSILRVGLGFHIFSFLHVLNIINCKSCTNFCIRLGWGVFQ